MARDSDVYEIKLKLYPQQVVPFHESLGYRMQRAGCFGAWDWQLAWNLAIAALLNKARQQTIDDLKEIVSTFQRQLETAPPAVIP